MNNIGYQLIRPFLKLFSIFTINPKIIGKENIPKGGYIFVGNHRSNYDPIIVGNINHRTIHFLAKKELFNNFFLGNILRFMGIIKVDRNNKNPEAKEEVLETLKDDNVICIFPEGTRNKTNELILPFKYGAVSFAAKSGKPIVPFVIKEKPKTFHRTKVIIGKPIYIKSNANLAYENEKLMKTIKRILKH